MIDALNKRLSKKGYSEIKIGIGIERGESLYIKAGYKGSGINEIVWIGKVVGESAKLSGYGSREKSDKRLMVSKNIYNMLNRNQQTYLNP